MPKGLRVARPASAVRQALIGWSKHQKAVFQAPTDWEHQCHFLMRHSSTSIFLHFVQISLKVHSGFFRLLKNATDPQLYKHAEEHTSTWLWYKRVPALPSVNMYQVQSAVFPHAGRQSRRASKQAVNIGIFAIWTARSAAPTYTEPLTWAHTWSFEGLDMPCPSSATAKPALSAGKGKGANLMLRLRLSMELLTNSRATCAVPPVA